MNIGTMLALATGGMAVYFVAKTAAGTSTVPNGGVPTPPESAAVPVTIPVTPPTATPQPPATPPATIPDSGLSPEDPIEVGMQLCGDLPEISMGYDRYGEVWFKPGCVTIHAKSGNNITIYYYSEEYDKLGRVVWSRSVIERGLDSGYMRLQRPR